MHTWQKDELANRQAIFLAGNQLAERWNSGPDTRFVIGEIGFGRGLGFLATWALWREKAAPDARLDYLSVESQPLELEDLRRQLKLWPELKPFAESLLDQYPCLLSKGFHRLSFDQQRVNLTLIVDEPQAGLERLHLSQHPLFKYPQAAIDAWYLDELSLSHMPEAAIDPLFSALASLSHPGSTLCSNFATQRVERALGTAGFSSQQIDEPDLPLRIEATVDRPNTSPEPADFVEGAYNSPFPPPWHCVRAPVVCPPNHKKRVIVIGGGIAGCHTAAALAHRGYQVNLLEQHAQLATQGSGNPQGVLYGKLSPREETLAEFNLNALEFGQRYYRDFWHAAPEAGQQCGVLQLAHTPKEEKLHHSLHARYGHADRLVEFVSPSRASLIAGIDVPHSGLYFPKAGWVNPARLCQHLVQHPNISVHTQVCIDALEYRDRWHALAPDGQSLYTADFVVIATANHTRQFSQTRHLPIKPVRGQVTYLPATDASRALKTAICSVGYIAPCAPQSQSHCIGASFDMKTSFDPTLESSETRQQDHIDNLDKIEGPTPALAHALNIDDHRQHSELLRGRAAFRCTTPDYLPLAGPAPCYEAFLKDYELLRKNAKSSIPRAGDYWPGLFLNVGHGSRGLTYSAVTAELLAAQIDNNPLPLPRHLVQALNPARFIIRDLIRKKI